MSMSDFREIYFCKFKLERYGEQITPNVNNIWRQETLNESTEQRWFKKFHKGDYEPNKGGGSDVVDDFLITWVEPDPQQNRLRNG